jgi:peptidoglycan hydrolase-like protein with peptidoglycan-binding domain
MARSLFARGARGFLVNRLQQSLASEGHYTGRVDGDYGGGTERAVMSFQRTANLPANGVTDDVTWTRSTHSELPSLFERCLQLTSRIEGHGFTIIQGNFDGAGLTWGLVGFTLKFGGIQRLVLAAQAAQPGVVQRAFCDRTTELLTRMREPLEAQLAWANSISSGRSNSVVAEPWRTSFSRFGEEPFVQSLQIQRARDVYFANAIDMTNSLGLTTELGFALCFDISVQNGSIKPAARAAIDARWKNARTKTEPKLRLIVAEEVANTAIARWRPDVLARKSAIATGAGEIHGEAFTLDRYGLIEVAGIV